MKFRWSHRICGSRVDVSGSVGSKRATQVVLRNSFLVIFFFFSSTQKGGVRVVVVVGSPKPLFQVY